jgi:hypothetical protein
MEVVKQTKEFTVVKKRSGRYGVKNAQNKWINGDEKVKILLGEGLIKAAAPAPKEEAPAEEAPAEEAAAEETTEEASE